MLQNDETDYASVCLSAIFQKYKLKVSIAKIRDIAETYRKPIAETKIYLTE